MPNKTVTIRRWQVVGAFVIVSASFVIGLAAVTFAIHRTHALAASASRLAIKTNDLTTRVNKESQRTRAVRNQQLALLHKSDVRACASRHKLTVVLRGEITRAIQQTKSQHFPGLTAVQQAALLKQREANIASLDLFLHDLGGADCTSVPPLPSVKKPPAKPKTPAKAKTPPANK